MTVAVQDLWKNYPVGDGELTVLKGISFSISQGEMVGIVGASGSGKSTLLHLLGALDSPTSGSVLIGGFNPFAGKDRMVSNFRNRYIGFVFQHNNLLPEFTALENVMMPGMIANLTYAESRNRAFELLERVGMSHRLKHFPGQLSGGEQQRIAIARALLNKPLLLLADEPSGNLDSDNAKNIHELFKEVNNDLATTMIIVTHNQQFASGMPRVIELKDGQIIGDTSYDNSTSVRASTDTLGL